MPYFRVEVTEVTRHEFWVCAHDEDAVWAIDTDDFADACSDNSGFVMVSERDITAVDPPRRTLPDGVDETDVHIFENEGDDESGDT